MSCIGGLFRGPATSVGSDATLAHVCRNYALLRGLQSFHPVHNLRDAPTLKFLPLEVLLDTKGTSADFDRVISRTNAALHYDKFNHLRLRNAMDAEEEGRSEHLRHHQVCPLLAEDTDIDIAEWVTSYP